MQDMDEHKLMKSRPKLSRKAMSNFFAAATGAFSFQFSMVSSLMNAHLEETSSCP